MSGLKVTGQTWKWGISIVLAVFASFFVGLAIWAFQSDVELVYDNYYEKDVVFEQQIRRVERTDALPLKPELKYKRNSESLTVKFPLEMRQPNPVGSVLLFRPSDLNLDRLFKLELKGDTLQTIALPDILPGLWRIKLNWQSLSQEYYLEEILVVN